MEEAEANEALYCSRLGLPEGGNGDDDDDDDDDDDGRGEERRSPPPPPPRCIYILGNAVS